MRFSHIFVCLTLMFVTPANADRLTYLPGLYDPDHHVIDAEALGRPFHVFVRLPADYDETDHDYPVVYLLDGDILFPIIAAYHVLLEFDEAVVPDAIIVGIAYGGLGRENGNFRSVDFSTPPLDDGDEAGGAAAFQKFLKNELIPFVEQRYRADEERRILFGQSRGGHFVLYSAFADPDLFWGRIASNPPLTPNKDFFFEPPTASDAKETMLYYASGSRDWDVLRQAALEWFAHWEAAADKPWRLKTVTMEDETHAAGVTNVYRAAMKWFFSNETSGAE